MQLTGLAIGLSAATFIGWNILYAVSFKLHDRSFLERLSISYGLGLGSVSMEMLLFHFFNLKFTIFNIIMPWAPLVVLNIFLYFTYGKTTRARSEAIVNDAGSVYLKIFLSAGIVLEILYTFFRALIKPIESYDAVAIYGMNMKALYLLRSIPRDFFSGIAQLFPHPDYPLNIPLSETLLCIFMGNLNDQLVKIIFPLYFVAILALLYIAIRGFASRSFALLFTFLLATIPQFSIYATNAYIDLPLSYYYFAGALFLFRWFEDTRRTPFLYLSAVMAALAGWTKNEGLMFSMVSIMLVVIFLLSKGKDRKNRELLHAFGYAAVIVFILSPWLWLKASAHLVNADLGSFSLNWLNPMTYIHKLWTIFYEFQREVFGPKKWDIFWPVIILAAVFYRKKIFTGNQKYVTALLAMIICGYIFAYLVAQNDVGYLVRTTWNRLMIHFLPIAVYWLAMLLKDDVEI